MTFTVTKGECTSCGLCVEDCPTRTIHMEAEGAFVYPADCIECSHCGMICPSNAIRVDGRKLLPYPEDAELTAEERQDHFILSKRSVRQYRPSPLGKEDLRAILRVGENTGTASNSQQIRPKVYQGGEVALLASELARSLMRFTSLGRTAPGRFILRLMGLGKDTKKEKILSYHNLLQGVLEGKRDPLFFKAPVVVILTHPAKGDKGFYRTDAALVGQNMMLCAHGRKIGSCVIGFAELGFFSKRLRKKIGIPRNRKIGLVFTLGHEGVKYLRYPQRYSWDIPL